MRVAVAIEGVDASYDPPTVAELKAAGKRFIVRYVSHTPAKNLTRPEADRYKAAGIGIVLVGQISKDRALGGFHQGQADMHTFREQARAVGAPDPCPIYMAVDFDVLSLPAVRGVAPGLRELAHRLADLPGNAQEGDPEALASIGPEGTKVAGLRSALRAGQMATVLAYVQGGASVNGHRYTGPYGEFDVMEANHAIAAGHYGWQTRSWSGGHWSAWAQLRQYRHNIPLGSGLVDFNLAVDSDYGQWGGQRPAGWWTRPLGEPELAQLRGAFEGALA
jgi:Domain of unknown function (DUF1906)